jgi:hypothetical protein
MRDTRTKPDVGERVHLVGSATTVAALSSLLRCPVAVLYNLNPSLLKLTVVPRGTKVKYVIG